MTSHFNTRHLARIRVELNGVDGSGHAFKQTAFTHDVSLGGACLEDAPQFVLPASVVEVRHGWKKGRFRVVWVGGLGKNYIGLQSLDHSRCIWGNPLPGRPIRSTPPASTGTREESNLDPWGNAQ